VFAYKYIKEINIRQGEGSSWRLAKAYCLVKDVASMRMRGYKTPILLLAVKVKALAPLTGGRSTTVLKVEISQPRTDK